MPGVLCELGAEGRVFSANVSKQSCFCCCCSCCCYSSSGLLHTREGLSVQLASQHSVVPAAAAAASHGPCHASHTCCVCFSPKLQISPWTSFHILLLLLLMCSAVLFPRWQCTRMRQAMSASSLGYAPTWAACSSGIRWRGSGTAPAMDLALTIRGITWQDLRPLI
jgi:hypothetical protein